MTGEHHFQRALDAHPGDGAARLLLAEWLAQRGDRRAAGYAWAAAAAVAPAPRRGGCGWTWAPALRVAEKAGGPPAGATRAVQRVGYADRGYLATYKTRHAAEDALAESFARLRPGEA